MKAFLLLLLLLPGCAALPPADGPDTTRKVDAQGHPNFGPP